MKKIAVIGAGISGMSVAHCLKDRYEIKLFEKTSRPGGLIKCNRENGNLYHLVGGHVFNSKHQDVLDWFWKFFSKEDEFVKAQRNAVIMMDNKLKINYPIENQIYKLESKKVKTIIDELLCLSQGGYPEADNFEDFLRNRFGNTLYEIYFQPYNEKIWKQNLKNVPLAWLEGKLPMPTISEIIYNNFIHAGDDKMVHSSFYYPKQDGSQFIANRFAENLNIEYDNNIESISRKDNKWIIDNQAFDKVIFCGNIKDFPNIFGIFLSIDSFARPIDELKYHGTTSVLCEIEGNPYSWIYLPSRQYSSHRIICTGNFAVSNNGENMHTCTVEFTNHLSVNDIVDNLHKMPFSPKYIAHNYEKYTYPIQDNKTKSIITELKVITEKENVFLSGRFAEWEYYNMDAAIKAAMNLGSSSFRVD
jgi:protoporphyrinogen oxidase